MDTPEKNADTDVEAGNSADRGLRRRQSSTSTAVSALHRMVKTTKKMPSNPPGWEKGTTRPEDLERQPNRVIGVNKEQAFGFVSNFVKTSKYEPYNFLYKFLWEEFNPRTKIANVYFLFIAVLQVIPAITNTYGIPLMLLPLTFVVAVDALFMIIEDVARHRADKHANSSITKCFDPTDKHFKKIKWSEIQVGDFIKIKNRTQIPADVLIVGVDEPHPESPGGVCYVETKSLDGETNLKIRHVMKNLVGDIMDPEDVAMLGGTVVMEHPNKLINNFNGMLKLRYRSAERERRMSDVRRASMASAASTDSQGPSKAEPIEPDNILLRGCVLRNTTWAVGLVLNTGPDTKIMMSMSEAPSKTSHLSSRVNTEIKRVALLMVLLCFVGAIGGSVWNGTNLEEMGYLSWSNAARNSKVVGVWVVQYFYYTLLLNGFIPISLYVSMNFVRFFQAWFMNQDLEMYHEEGDVPARVRTMNLNEDLGQVSHIFSDKTGTLTCNVMDFRKCTVGGRSYGKGMTEIGKAALTVAGKNVPQEILEAEERAKQHAAPHVNFYDPMIYEDWQGNSSHGQEQAERLSQFFTALAVCHTVIPEKFEDSDEVVLSASSPDDEALVLGAKYFGVEFLDRLDSSAIIRRRTVTGPPNQAAQATLPPPDSPETGGAEKPPGGGSAKGDEWEGSVREEYEVLHILGFNSDRKRMSVLVRCPDGKIRVYTKGADTVMLPRLRMETSKDQSTLEVTVQQMDEFAKEGLRTLVVACAELTDQEYEHWAEAFEEVSTNMEEIEKKNSGLPNKIEEAMERIERNLYLLGTTAIEDKLQDGVPNAIADLMAAGIKVWVLTGDKEETAINIAVACQLVWAEERMDRMVINLKVEPGEKVPTTEDIQKLLEGEYERAGREHEMWLEGLLPEEPKPKCLIIDGPALLEAQRTTECQGALLAYAQICDAVVGCRVTPDQKRAMVALVRHGVKGVRTLSIGDGANDVPMIQGAHIGVGISGQEGMQAVNASDYAIGQFRFLKPLLLVHGRWNYRRSSKVVCYLFYKSVISAAPLFFYSWVNGFSGTLFYDYIATNLYAVVFTALPILLYGIYDQDVSRENCLQYPQLYSQGIDDTWLTPRIFWSWMLQALFEGAFFTFIPLYFLGGDRETRGLTTSLYEPGTLCYALIVLSVSIKMYWVQYRWTWFHLLVVCVSAALFYLAETVINYIFALNYDFYGVMNVLMRNPSFWLVTAWCLTAVFMRDLGWKFYHRWWEPGLNSVLIETESCRLKPVDVHALEEQQRQQSGGGDKPGGGLVPQGSQEKRSSVSAWDMSISLSPDPVTPKPRPPPPKRRASSLDPRRASELLSPETSITVAWDDQRTPRILRTNGSRGCLRGSAMDLASPCGFAFSTDEKAQTAEIDMIMGMRSAPLKRTASFCERRASLAASREERRESIAGPTHRKAATTGGGELLTQSEIKAVHRMRNAALENLRPLSGIMEEKQGTSSSVNGSPSGSPRPSAHLLTPKAQAHASHLSDPGPSTEQQRNLWDRVSEGLLGVLGRTEGPQPGAEADAAELAAASAASAAEPTADQHDRE